jgi:hypothetical protein
MLFVNKIKDKQQSRLVFMRYTARRLRTTEWVQEIVPCEPTDGFAKQIWVPIIGHVRFLQWCSLFKKCLLKQLTLIMRADIWSWRGSHFLYWLSNGAQHLRQRKDVATFQWFKQQSEKIASLQ